MRYTNVIQQSWWQVPKVKLDTNGIQSWASGQPHRISPANRFQWREAGLGNSEVRRSTERDRRLRIRTEDGGGGNVPIDRDDDRTLRALVRERGELVLKVQQVLVQRQLARDHVIAMFFKQIEVVIETAGSED